MTYKKQALDALVKWFNDRPDEERIVRGTDFPVYRIRVTEHDGEEEFIIGDRSPTINTKVLSDVTYLWTGLKNVRVKARTLDFFELVEAPIASGADETGDISLSKDDVGLSEVDNTSDLDKPVSSATQDALDGKVDKEIGKQLSDENYTLDEKNKLASLENFDDSAIQVELATKVDKAEGKGLSEEDFTAAEKAKLALIENYDDSEVRGLIDGKVDKVAGKQLSDENFTSPEKSKLAGLENYDDTAINDVLGTKVDKVAGKQLSDENFTTALKDKLDSLSPDSGGVGSIVAGSGITVDDSDPANPVVSATGSAGTEVNVQSGAAYTLVLTDAFKMVTMDNAGANTLTVPPDTTVAFPTDTRIDLGQDGAGQTTVVAGAGVTIRTPETLKLRKQWSKASLIRRAADVWDIVGDLEAAT